MSTIPNAEETRLLEVAEEEVKEVLRYNAYPPGKIGQIIAGAKMLMSQLKDSKRAQHPDRLLRELVAVSLLKTMYQKVSDDVWNHQTSSSDDMDELEEAYYLIDINDSNNDSFGFRSTSANCIHGFAYNPEKEPGTRSFLKVQQFNVSDPLLNEVFINKVLNKIEDVWYEMSVVAKLEQGIDPKEAAEKAERNKVISRYEAHGLIKFNNPLTDVSGPLIDSGVYQYCLTSDLTPLVPLYDMFFTRDTVTGKPRPKEIDVFSAFGKFLMTTINHCMSRIVGFGATIGFSHNDLHMNNFVFRNVKNNRDILPTIIDYGRCYIDLDNPSVQTVYNDVQAGFAQIAKQFGIADNKPDPVSRKEMEPKYKLDSAKAADMYLRYHGRLKDYRIEHKLGYMCDVATVSWHCISLLKYFPYPTWCRHMLHKRSDGMRDVILYIGPLTQIVDFAKHNIDLDTSIKNVVGLLDGLLRAQTQTKPQEQQQQQQTPKANAPPNTRPLKKRKLQPGSTTINKPNAGTVDDPYAYIRKLVEMDDGDKDRFFHHYFKIFYLGLAFLATCIHALNDVDVDPNASDDEKNKKRKYSHDGEGFFKFPLSHLKTLPSALAAARGRPVEQRLMISNGCFNPTIFEKIKDRVSKEWPEDGILADMGLRVSQAVQAGGRDHDPADVLKEIGLLQIEDVGIGSVPKKGVCAMYQIKEGGPGKDELENVLGIPSYNMCRSKCGWTNELDFMLRKVPCNVVLDAKSKEELYASGLMTNDCASPCDIEKFANSFDDDNACSFMIDSDKEIYKKFTAGNRQAGGSAGKARVYKVRKERNTGRRYVSRGRDKRWYLDEHKGAYRYVDGTEKGEITMRSRAQ